MEILLIISVAISLVVFALVCFWRLNYGLASLVLFLPFYVVRFKIFLPLTFLECLVLILFLVWLLRHAIKIDFLFTIRSLVFKLRKNQFLYPLLLFIAAAIISIFVSPNKIAAVGIWKAYFIEPIIIFLILIDIIRTKKAISLIIVGLGFSAIWVSLIAIYQKFTGLAIPDPVWQAEETRRVTSIFGYPNAVGLYVAPIAALYSGLIIYSLYKNNLKKILFYGSIILLSILAMVFAVSQGAWAGLLSSIVIMVLVSRYRKLAIIILAVVIVLVLIIPTTRDYIWPLVTFQDVSGDVRLVLWQGTWNLIKDRPIFGAGLAGFQSMYDRYRLAKHTELLVYPHNIIFNFWTETGLLGLIAFIWLSVTFLRKAKKILFWDGKVSPFGKRQKTKGEIKETKKISFFGPWPITSSSGFIALGLMGALVCVFIHGLVDVPYFKNDLSVMFWVFMGLLISLNKS